LNRVKFYRNNRYYVPGISGENQGLQRVLAKKEGNLEYVLDNIWLKDHNNTVKWIVQFHEDFELEFDALPEEVQDEMLAHPNCSNSLARSLAGPASIPSRIPATRT
jgi:hypothetical protein